MDYFWLRWNCAMEEICRLLGFFTFMFKYPRHLWSRSTSSLVLKIQNKFRDCLNRAPIWNCAHILRWMFHRDVVLYRFNWDFMEHFCWCMGRSLHFSGFFFLLNGHHIRWGEISRWFMGCIYLFRERFSYNSDGMLLEIEFPVQIKHLNDSAFEGS